MKKWIRFFKIIKYVGLLGLPGFLFDIPIIKLFWLFWLFGLVEVFAELPILIQSLKQIAGMLVIPIRYGTKLPNKNNFKSSVKYSLPFSDAWVVVNGGVDKMYSHSWSIPTQRYAYDFLILDENGNSNSGNPSSAPSYYCYGKEILAPADGTVVEVSTNHPDSDLSGTGAVDCKAHDIRGNYIIIRHTDKEYSLLAHLQPNSIRVKVGDFVMQGQPIANCGNSGNTSEPHLHFQLQDNKSFFYSAGLPIQFDNISIETTVNYNHFDARQAADCSRKDTHIARGQKVKNR